MNIHDDPRTDENDNVLPLTTTWTPSRSTPDDVTPHLYSDSGNDDDDDDI